MYRIGVIGDRESVLGFKAVGLEVFPCDSQQEAKKTFKNIAEDNFSHHLCDRSLLQGNGG